MATIFLFSQEYFHTVFNSAPNNQERFPLEPSYTWSHLLCGNDQHRREWLIIALSCLADILETSASFASKKHQLWVQFQLDKGLWIVLIVHWKLIDDLQCRRHLTELSRNFSCHRFTNVIFQPLIFFYSTPSTEGVESTRGNSVGLCVCVFVRNHFFLLRIFNDLMI